MRSAHAFSNSVRASPHIAFAAIYHCFTSPLGAQQPLASHCRGDQTSFLPKHNCGTTAATVGSPWLEDASHDCCGTFGGMDDTSGDAAEDMSLGAPPPLPKLKRARACSFSPDRNYINFFAEDQSQDDGPHQ